MGETKEMLRYLLMDVLPSSLLPPVNSCFSTPVAPISQDVSFEAELGSELGFAVGGKWSICCRIGLVIMFAMMRREGQEG